MIIPVYKPLGASTHKLAEKIGKLHATKATHTGTLDPMAEGVVIVLTDIDRFQKSELSDCKKTYNFSILWGVKTDSDDLLGLQKRTEYLDAAAHSQIINHIPDALDAIKQQKTQRIPNFSAKRIEGVSYFDKAKKNVPTPDHQQEIIIFSLTLDSYSTKTKNQLTRYTTATIPTVTGDFRQSSILDAWETYFSATHNHNFLVTHHTCVCSKRTYIRAIVRDLSRSLEIPATTFSILRSQNGEYGIGDCICLI